MSNISELRRVQKELVIEYKHQAHVLEHMTGVDLPLVNETRTNSETQLAAAIVSLGERIHQIKQDVIKFEQLERLVMVQSKMIFKTCEEHGITAPKLQFSTQGTES